MSVLEICGAVLALLYLVLAMREKPLCWAAAIASSICYLRVFYEAKLYTESALQLFFIALSIYGLNRWRRGVTEGAALRIRRIAYNELFAGVLITSCLSLALAFFVSSSTDADFPYVDSFITCFSIYTTYLVSEKVLENWMLWVIIDLGAALLYFQKDLLPTAILFLIYVLLALRGHFQWKSAMERAA